MDLVEEIVENPHSIWFEDGTYQGGTTREVETINVYDDEYKNLVAIFKRSTGEFITVCQPNLLDNQMLPVTVFELVILPSYGKIPKILSLLNNPWVIEL